MSVILKVSTEHFEKGITAGIAIGYTVALCALFAGPSCGASMNPASSLGLTLISGRLTDIWIYICAPLIGALAAVLIFNNTNKKAAVKVKAS